MAESAALLVDEVLPEQPMRQWVLSFPFQLRFLFGVVCGKGRNPTLRLWPAIFSGEIDVFPGALLQIVGGDKLIIPFC
ncbi:hypothetical protein BMT66_25495 [Escherichia coli]|nr:hypothetical protein BMT66_25495 [Escherichia coli]